MNVKNMDTIVMFVVVVCVEATAGVHGHVKVQAPRGFSGPTTNIVVRRRKNFLSNILTSKRKNSSHDTI